MAETIRRIQQQTSNLFGGMEFHQKVTFVLLAIMVMIPFGLLIFGSQDGGDVPLQWGAAFDRDVLMQAEQALIDRGFNDFRTVGQRIMAPSSKVEEYNGALSAAGIWSPHAASELEAALKDASVFTPKNQFDALMDVHLRKEIRNILRTVDGVQDVQVMWSRPEGGSRWRSQSPVKASVHVTPRGNRALSSSLVESLRATVASMVPDLHRENVVIMDRSTGQAWTGGDPNDPFDNKLEELKRGRVQFRQNQIRAALEEMIPNVIVAVNVEFDDVLSVRERSQKIDKTAVELTNIQETATSTSSDGPAGGQPGTQANQPRSVASSGGRQSTTNDQDTKTQSYSAPSMTVSETERAPLSEKSLQVAVSIPKDHFDQLLLRDGMTPGESDQEKADYKKAFDELETLTIANVRDIVTRLIPPDSAEDAITVKTHQRIEPELPPSDLPVTDMIHDFVSNWGSSIALTLFGLWALVMLKKSMPVSESAPGTDAIDKLAEAVRPPEPELEEENKPLTNRDFLQMSVQDDPAAAAAILSKWLQKA